LCFMNFFATIAVKPIRSALEARAF
jgi:hypothetical protein